MIYRRPKEREEQEEVLFSELNQPVKPKFFQKKGTIIALSFSAMWFIFVIDYLMSSGWWASRGDLSPAEFIGGISGLLLPIVIAWLVTAYFDRSEQLEYEANTLKSYLNELVYPSAEGAVYTKTLTDALRTQIKEFRSVFNEVNEQTQNVRTDLKEWIADLSKIIDHVDNQTVLAVKEMAGHIHHLAEATEIANDQANRASELFAQQADLLEKISAKVVQDMNNMSSSLNMNLDDLKNTAHAIENVNERTAKAVEGSERVAGLLQEQAKLIENSVQSYETSAKQQNARLFGNLEKVLSVFRAQGDLLDQEVEKTTNRLRVAESLFIEKTKGLFQSSDEAIFRLTEASALFDRKAKNVSELLAQTKGEMVALNQLIPVAQKGMQAAAQLERGKSAAEKEAQKADFLAEAQVILDRLQGFSVDMAHIWTPKQEEELWKRYYAGDKAVFMRHISKSLSGSKAAKINELYQTNKSFRMTVARYMAEFEGLTQMARRESDNNLLMGILIGSDVGRLYMVLADVLKKEA